MEIKQVGVACGLVMIVTSSVTVTLADNSSSNTDATMLADLTGKQSILELPVRVVDEQGNPVAGAKIAPWALRSSQGHGWWREDDERAGVGPEEIFTDDGGHAAVLYPYFRHVEEQIRTTSVSLYVDHPDYGYINSLHIDVPIENQEPHEIKLTPGAALVVHPMIDDQRADLDDLFAFWSDGRSWLPGAGPMRTTEDALRFSAMPPGVNSVLMVKLDGDRATHFSQITELELKMGEPKKIDIPLRPALRIEGVLSDNVPRPVRKGRIKALTLHPAEAGPRRVSWLTWAPIRPDGTFTIDGWPVGEKLQLIALCEGYIATSGKAPDAVKNPRDPDKDPFIRPQVFDPTGGGRIEVAMTPLVNCVVTAVDEDNQQVAGVTVTTCPNVCWWNNGSQIYCEMLVRGERLLRERNYFNVLDEAFPPPFLGKTDGDGKVTLELPAGKEDLLVIGDAYQLPVFLGNRRVRVELTPGETTEVLLHLQPRGTERLGEWDKLAGVVFGCSTREGRRICALPEVREQMDEFVRRFREGKNRRDPQLLSEAYSAVADAFDGAGDAAEAAKWRLKAAEQAEKIEDAESATAN